jgi:hypothetical protein
MQPDDIGVGELFQDGNLPHDLGHPGRVATQLILLDELDGNLKRRVLLVMGGKGGGIAKSKREIGSH